MVSPRPRANLRGRTWRAIDDEYVVYDPEHGRAHVLDGPASRLLRRCDGSTPTRELVRRAAADESLPTATLMDRLDELDAAGLIEWSHGERRRFLRRAATLGVGVVTLTIPGPAGAVSCAGLLESCQTLPCCEGLSCLGGTCVPG